MQHEDRVYLEHMLDAATRAHGKVAGRSLQDWESDEDLRLAVTHLVQTLGEAARRVSEKGRSAHPAVPWGDVIGMRNIIVHDYLGVDDRIVRTVALRDLPSLIEALRKGLERL
jgi:uncharacterized protein with HEPN domain